MYVLDKLAKRSLSLSASAGILEVVRVYCVCAGSSFTDVFEVEGRRRSHFAQCAA